MTTYIPTLTVKQVYERMSELGLKTSERKIRAMINQGKYPWGVSCQMKHREYEIYEVLFDLWLESVTKTVDENALFDWGNKESSEN